MWHTFYRFFNRYEQTLQWVLYLSHMNPFIRSDSVNVYYYIDFCILLKTFSSLLWWLEVRHLALVQWRWLLELCYHPKHPVINLKFIFLENYIILTSLPVNPFPSQTLIYLKCTFKMYYLAYATAVLIRTEQKLHPVFHFELLLGISTVET